MGTRCADHVTPLCPQKLALTSPTGGGRFVGIVRSQTKATEFFIQLYAITFHSTLKLKRAVLHFLTQTDLVESTAFTPSTANVKL
jgi:hypothetical protein